MAKKVVLAYSGGLDTSVAVRWMAEEWGVDVVAVAVDVGQGGDFDVIRTRALAAGAVEVVVVDCVEQYANEYVAPALKANALYEGRYPLVSSLSRPIIVEHLGPDPGGLHRLRRAAQHPGQRHQGEPVLDRREPVGQGHRVRRAGGPVGV